MFFLASPSSGWFFLLQKFGIFTELELGDPMPEPPYSEGFLFVIGAGDTLIFIA
jgi:hypothetical protein